MYTYNNDPYEIDMYFVREDMRNSLREVKESINTYFGLHKDCDSVFLKFLEAEAEKSGWADLLYEELGLTRYHRAAVRGDSSLYEDLLLQDLHGSYN